MKIKPLNKEQLIISIDRLTRFKYPERKYLRVFKDVILHNLIFPRFNRHELDGMEYFKLKEYAQDVINFSIKKITGKNSQDNTLNQKLYDYENSVFNLNKDINELLNNHIDYFTFLDFVDDSATNNLKWLKCLAYSKDIKNSRKELGLKFPAELVILAEGATEEILLPEFGRLCGLDFDKAGVILIPAGGKNKVVRLYYDLSLELKIPIFVLMDKDGQDNAREIEPRLRQNDKIHLIQSGEFEDMLPDNLVKKTLKEELENISVIDETLQEEKGHRVKYLEEIFKNRGLHEFKKAEFAKLIKDNITETTKVTPEILAIITEIKNMI